MKVLICSDSHGLTEELEQVIRRHQHEVEAIIHCGDSELPKKTFSHYKNLFIVGGNCDYDPEYEDEILTSVSGVNVFVVHGHLHNVKNSAVNLSYRGEELGAKLVCYGHTHIAISFFENGVLYVNPGSLKLPRKRIERSYTIVEYKEDDIIVIYYDHLGNEITDLKCTYKLV